MTTSSKTTSKTAPKTARSQGIPSWSVDSIVRDLQSVEDCFRFGVSQLRRFDLNFLNGPGSAEAEAFFALSEILYLDQSELEQWRLQKLTDHEKRTFLNCLKQRCELQKPMPYVLGATYYCGHRLEIDTRALIPRSVIGTMLEDYFEVYDYNSPWRILDLGTGAGGIAVAFAKAFPNATLVATDIDPAALEIAAHNVELHGLSSRVTVLESDGFAALKGQEFDWILCNPPYVSEDFKQVMAREYTFEPEIALFGGEDGLGFIDTLINQASQYLQPKGILAFECGDITSMVVREKYQGLSGEWYCHPESGNPVALTCTKSQLETFQANPSQ